MPKTQKQNELKDGQAKMKADPESRPHVPYILNGELYRIESQNGDNVTVKCCYCPPDRTFRGSVRSTGNFHMHIKRRHASLLGKLHEMKVAALVERRDRIMQNRRTAKTHKKSTSSIAEAASAESHELKIKTVFQRHKQEHNKQEEAAAIRTCVSDSVLDNNSQSSGQNSSSASNEDNTNNISNTSTNPTTTTTTNYNNIQQLLKDLSNLQSACAANKNVILPAQDASAPMVRIPRLLPFRLIKPEQNNQVAEEEQPEAIDLSRTSSMQSDDLDENMGGHPMQSVQIHVSRTQDLAAYLNGAPHEERIGNSLAEIKREMQKRNQIEHNRLLFDMAKFKFMHPNFNFDAVE